MKHLKTTLLIGLLSITFAPTLFAQNIDANRMNRDIRIMENILAEIFRTQIETATAETYIIAEGHFRHRGIRGTYLKDFGIIFMVPSNDPFTPRMHVTDGSGFSFYYGSDDDNDGDNAERDIDEDSIKRRITEFLVGYGSTIGQLEDDDRIMVIYGSQNNNQRTLWNYRIAVDGEVINTQKESLPVISASVSVKDLKDYRGGGLNDSQIKDRINFATSEDKEFMDLKVMGNIFETGLDGRSDDAFRISGGISYLMLDNFGAIFSFDARFRGNRDILFGRLAQAQRQLRIVREEQIRTGRRAEGFEEQEAAIEERQEELKENMIAAYDDLKTAISEYLVDYGRTISSVNSDQFILTSVNLSNNGYDEVPERVDFQIKKSILEQLDRGRISRDDALNSVSITEY